MQKYTELIVWQKAVEITCQLYAVTGQFPSEEKFGLTSQMRRAAVSIPSNIAEGYARKNKKENAHFVSIAYGSATELETQLIIAKRLNFLQEDTFASIHPLLEEVLKLLYRYREYLQRHPTLHTPNPER